MIDFAGSQITRTHGISDQMPWPRDLSQSRYWSAMVMSNSDVSVPAGETANLQTNMPRHATNGDSDFDVTSYPVIKLIVPWDGIYAINAFGAASPYAAANGGVQMIITTSSGDVDPGRAVAPFNGSSLFEGLEATRVGFPMTAGTRIWAWAGNYTDQQVTFSIEHLEATYLCPLGTLYPIKGGPT